MPGQTSGFPGTSPGRTGVLQRSRRRRRLSFSSSGILLHADTHTARVPFTDGERLARSISECSGNRIEKWVSRHAGTILSRGESSRRTEEDTHEPLNAVVARPLQTSVFSAVKANLRREKRYWVSTPRGVTSFYKPQCFTRKMDNVKPLLVPLLDVRTCNFTCRVGSSDSELAA